MLPLIAILLTAPANVAVNEIPEKNLANLSADEISETLGIVIVYFPTPSKLAAIKSFSTAWSKISLILFSIISPPASV